MRANIGVILKLLGPLFDIKPLFPETHHVASKPWGRPHDFTEDVDFEASRPSFHAKVDFQRNSPWDLETMGKSQLLVENWA